MDLSLVLAAVNLKAASTQQQVGTAVLKQSLDAQASVLQLLQPSQSAPAANTAPGIGSLLDRSA